MRVGVLASGSGTILRAMLDRGLPARTMMTAFGPGFTCAGLVLER